MERLLRLKEAAELLAVSSGGLYKRIWRGEPVPYVKMGKCYRFRESDLNSYIEGLKPKKRKK